MSATYSPASTMVDPLSPHLLSPHDHELSRHLESPLEPLPTDPEPDLDALVELGTLGTPVGSPRKRPSLDDAAGFGARDKLRRLESIAAALARCGGSMATERDILRFLLAQNEDGDVVDDEDDEEDEFEYDYDSVGTETDTEETDDEGYHPHHTNEKSGHGIGLGLKLHDVHDTTTRLPVDNDPDQDLEDLYRFALPAEHEHDTLEIEMGTDLIDPSVPNKS